MERLRWLPESLGERHVWVNIPEFLIRVVDKGDTVSTIRACVGEPKHATPILVNKPMTNAIFSPVWNIPTNIAKEEMEFILMNPAVIVVADVDVWLDGQKVNPSILIGMMSICAACVCASAPKKPIVWGRLNFLLPTAIIFICTTPLIKPIFGRLPRC